MSLELNNVIGNGAAVKRILPTPRTPILGGFPPKKSNDGNYQGF